MFTRGFVTIAILTNAVIGNVCMMPMAMAADMPMPHDMHASAAMMTPMAPMSRADCDHCPHHDEKKAVAQQQSSSCGGHCLSQATNTNPSNLTLGSSQLIADLPPTIGVQWSATEDTVAEPNINPSPPLTSTDSVVLRL